MDKIRQSYPIVEEGRKLVKKDPSLEMPYKLLLDLINDLLMQDPEDKKISEALEEAYLYGVVVGLKHNKEK